MAQLKNIFTKAGALVAVIVALVMAFFVWRLVSRPVLLEIGDRFSILNPFRSRAPEETADIFLRAASMGQCSPDLRADLCGFVKKHPVPAMEASLGSRTYWTYRIFQTKRASSRSLRTKGIVRNFWVNPGTRAPTKPSARVVTSSW